MSKINLAQKFSLFDEYWTPKIIAELNGQQVKLAKFKGEMVWHSHADEDEYFQVIEGEVAIHLRDDVITLSAGECYVVPKGVEHKPQALSDEAHVLLFEPLSTAHTGDIDSPVTVANEAQVWI